MRYPAKMEKHVNGRGWFHMSRYGKRCIVRLRMAAYAANWIAPGSDSCGKRHTIGWRKFGNPRIWRHSWVFPFTQTRKESANAWVNVDLCMESDHSHTAYRIRLPQPQAALIRLPRTCIWNPSLIAPGLDIFLGLTVMSIIVVWAIDSSKFLYLLQFMLWFS